MKKEKQKSAVDKLIAKYNKQWNKYGMGSVISYSQVVAELEKVKEEMEKEQRQKKENQFVLNMPFDIQPLTKEVEMSSPSHKQELVIGYVIKDAKGVEYYFYEEDGVLKYDGWSADLPTTKTEE
jgi:hypothetical protein